MRDTENPALQGFLLYNKNNNGDNMKIDIYSKEGCSYCIRAKQHFASHNLTYTEHDLAVAGTKELLQARLPEGYTLKQVPQIFIDNVHIGGYIDMVEWFLARTKLKDGVA